MIVHGIGAFRDIVCHKINLLGLLIDTDQLLNDQLLLTGIQKISLTDASVLRQTIPIQMGKAVSFALPKSISSVFRNKIGKQIAPVSVKQAKGTEIEKTICRLTDHCSTGSVFCVPQIKAGLLISPGNPGEIKMTAVLHPFDRRLFFGGKDRIQKIRCIYLHKSFFHHRTNVQVVVRNFLIRICHKGTGILIKFRAQIRKAVCVGCDQRKLFCTSAISAVGDKASAVRAPEHLRMLLIALTPYCDLTVNINITAIFQILLSVKSQLRLFSGFFLSQDQIVLHIGKRVRTVRRCRCLCLSAAFLPCPLRLCLF